MFVNLKSRSLAWNGFSNLCQHFKYLTVSFLKNIKASKINGYACATYSLCWDHGSRVIHSLHIMTSLQRWVCFSMPLQNIAHCSKIHKLIFFHMHTVVKAEFLCSLPRVSQVVYKMVQLKSHTIELCFGGLCVWFNMWTHLRLSYAVGVWV